jgi:hypothetical protein
VLRAFQVDGLDAIAVLGLLLLCGLKAYPAPVCRLLSCMESLKMNIAALKTVLREFAGTCLSSVAAAVAALLSSMNQAL